MTQKLFELINTCLCEGFTNQQMQLIDARKEGINTQTIFHSINSDILYDKWLVLYLKKNMTYPFLQRLKHQPNIICTMEDPNEYIYCYKV